MARKLLQSLISLPRMVVVGIFKVYKVAISPLLPASCRFVPTCSEYGITALQRFGLVKGLYLTVRRIIRCRPGGDYGYDPVPETWENKQERKRT